MKRKKFMPALKDDEIPIVESYGLNKKTAVGVSDPQSMNDRGGGISVPLFDPHAKKVG
jgi:hypothetical protein